MLAGPHGHARRDAVALLARGYNAIVDFEIVALRQAVLLGHRGAPHGGPAPSRRRVPLFASSGARRRRPRQAIAPPAPVVLHGVVHGLHPVMLPRTCRSAGPGIGPRRAAVATPRLAAPLSGGAPWQTLCHEPLDAVPWLHALAHTPGGSCCLRCRRFCVSARRAACATARCPVATLMVHSAYALVVAESPLGPPARGAIALQPWRRHLPLAQGPQALHACLRCGALHRGVPCRPPGRIARDAVARITGGPSTRP